MPELVIPADALQVSLHFRITGDAEDMICGFGVDQIDVETPDFVMDAMAAAWDTFVSPQWSSAVSLVGAEARNADGTVGEQVYDLPGAVAGDIQTQNTALLVKKVTPRVGRTGRGRIFLPGVLTANVGNAGVIESTQLATWQGDWTTWLNDVNTTLPAARVCLLHTNAPGVDTDPSPITGLVVDPMVATQRRRLRP